MRVRLLESAHRDLAEGFLFYERQGAGLGDLFADTLYAELEALSWSGGIHPVRFGFHFAVSRRFPCSIYYDATDGEVRVHAILDNRRDPARLARRLRSLARKSRSR